MKFPGRSASKARMKKTLARYLIILGTIALLPGCISIPPLVQVQHRETITPNDELKRRLDSIDHRLEQLEKTSMKKPDA